AQGAVGEPVGAEVQIVEHDQRAELQRRVDGAAGGASDHRRRAELVERPDVGAVGDLVGEADVPGRVPGYVKRLDAAVDSADDVACAIGRVHGDRFSLEEPG